MDTGESRKNTMGPKIETPQPTWTDAANHTTRLTPSPPPNTTSQALDVAPRSVWMVYKAFSDPLHSESQWVDAIRLLIESPSGRSEQSWESFVPSAVTDLKISFVKSPSLVGNVLPGFHYFLLPTTICCSEGHPFTSSWTAAVCYTRAAATVRRLTRMIEPLHTFSATFTCYSLIHLTISLTHPSASFLFCSILLCICALVCILCTVTYARAWFAFYGNLAEKLGNLSMYIINPTISQRINCIVWVWADMSVHCTQ